MCYSFRLAVGVSCALWPAPRGHGATPTYRRTVDDQGIRVVEPVSTARPSRSAARTESLGVDAIASLTTNGGVAGTPTGACCTGEEFSICAETTEPDCVGGLFRPGLTCGAGACTPVHVGYANTFGVSGFHRADVANRLRADDIRLLNDGPCELAGYEIEVIGNGILGPPAFDATVELWTNHAPDPQNELLDVPGIPITGTSKLFRDLPANFVPMFLVAGAFDTPPLQPIQLDDKLWIVISTSSAYAGPMLGGPAKLGYSLDAFAQLGVLTPGVWNSGFWFGGFDPTGCPDGATCRPAGSFRAKVWCSGPRPSGACCNDGDSACSDGATSLTCDGQWAGASTCAAEPFDPACGDGACCYVPSPPSPIVCAVMSQQACSATNGEFAVGTPCAETICPSPACTGAGGDCFVAHAGGGCEGGFCCERVCALDSFCCLVEWDAACALRARDLCAPPVSDDYDTPTLVSGEGPAPFDNNMATTDGPSHSECDTLGDAGGIFNDLWFCWTASCSGLVGISTCDATQVDTKLAVYDGCGLSPSDSTLIACDDDACGMQSRLSFMAQEGSGYLIRVGSFPGVPAEGSEFPVLADGVGVFSIMCATSHPACPSPGSCFADHDAPGCQDAFCCNTVCDCDPYCCDTEWDEFCAAAGVNGDCGAALLCGPCSNCNDALFCNGAETCINLECGAGTPVDCDDTIGCTVDICDEFENACVHEPDHSACDNGLFCDGVEACSPVVGCVPGVRPCVGSTSLICDELNERCVECVGDGGCDDGLFCNGKETCGSDGPCAAGTPPCDGQPCDESGDICQPAAIPAVSTWGLVLLAALLLVMAKIRYSTMRAGRRFLG